ncbi:MAG: alpha/beta hydrolase [Dehalococcoidia bacterium]
MGTNIKRCSSADGVAITYTAFGSGPPLLLAMSWATTIDGQLSNAGAAPFYERLAAARRVVMFDRRGVGASGRDPADLSMPAQLADIRAVAGALGIERCDVLGDNDGCYVAVAWATAYPKRVARLALWSPLVTGRDARPAQMRAFAQLMRDDWTAACQQWARYRATEAEERQRIAETFGAMTSPRVAASYLEWEADEDLTELLPRVIAPALVVNTRRGGPRSLGVASLLADGRFVTVDPPKGADDLDLAELARIIIEFLDREPG